ncbi:NRDE family protein [Altererythrobacter sp. MF3-039]|uniref:NRDE family protein n=1 Tax=Altererythrobacter sp. MF3-039 TaxID=3252901 RepID=UPI00390C462F
MCVAAFAWHAHPDWPLIAIGNRDEFHERPAASLDKWAGEPGILAGRDLQSGGTWLGVSEAGRFVLVTNLRGYGQPDPRKRSRGELVTNLLAGEADPRDADQLALHAYNPFNLFCADVSGARFLTNRPESVSTGLAHGIYGVSNGTLDEPWAKTVYLKGAVLDWLNATSNDAEPLFDALTNRAVRDMGLLPRDQSEIAVEPSETPPFICHPLYGTRCSTVVMIDRKGNGRIIERSFDAEGQARGEIDLEFGWKQSQAGPNP